MNEYKNQVRIVGKIGKEPTLHTGKMSCLKLSVYTKGEPVEHNGETFEPITWHNVVIFGKEAEKLKVSLELWGWVEVVGSISKHKFNKITFDQIQADSIKDLSQAPTSTKRKKA